MLHKAVAISTLAVLAAGELTNQAIANPDLSTSTPKPAASNYVVPVEVSPSLQSAGAIAPPEVAHRPEFSQTSRTPVSATPQSSATSTKATNSNAIAQSTRTPTRSTNDLAVIAIDVQVVGATEELQQIVLNTVRTRSGGSTTQSQLQNDVAAILNTGLFTDARVSTTSNRDGLKVVYQVQPVVVRSLQLTGNEVLTPAVANNVFKSQLGQPISPTALRQGINS